MATHPTRNQSDLQLFQRDPSVVFRKIVDEYILVPVRRSAADLDSIYNLNEIGARIWELLDGTNSAAGIRDILVQEFEVTPETAAKDLAAFLAQLEAASLIKPA